MSIQDSGAAVSYSDHEIQWIRNSYSFRDAADAGPNTSLDDQAEFNVTERGLDNDELAELVYLRADISLGLNSTGDQTTRNAFTALTDWGANLAGSENLLTDANTEQFDVDDSGTDDFTRRFRVTDEAGEFVSEIMRANIGHRDTANSVAAGPVTDRVQVEVDFRNLYGQGPFLDSTDDLTNRVFFTVTNAIDSASLDQILTLGWNVQTVEGGRASFAGPMD